MYQGRWSAAQRDMETDIVPMCQAEGMAIVPWGTLGGGKLKHSRDHDPTQGRQFPDPPKEMRKIGEKIRNLAEQMKTHPTALALAYIMSKAPYTFPIVGVRTVEQLKQNLQALELQIDEGTVRAIDQCVPFDTRFPLSFLAGENIKGAFGPEDVYFTKECGTFDFPARPRVSIRCSGTYINVIMHNNRCNNTRLFQIIGRRQETSNYWVAIYEDCSGGTAED